jgi:folylpolyglutamate synthase/dihydropteroate synthase
VWGSFQNSFIAPYLILTVVVIICNKKRVSQERFENFFKKNELKSYDPLNQEPNCTFLWVVIALNFNLFCGGVLFYEGLVVFFLEMGITERFYL